ncbi:MAG: iron-containing redox enzyme family protein [Proteobacteria bacterium]|nr:iron-containing redox enzyme family protein [Pseudomonadota bacterium]
MPLTVETTLAEIAKIHKSKPLFGHPLWTAWGAGELSREQLKECVKQAGIIPLHNHNYHGRLYVICPDPAWRARIAEVCYEEGTGRLYANGVSHHELYVRFAQALGITREELYATRYCSGAVAFKAYFSGICSKDFLEGVSAHMLAAEAPVPAHGSKRADALRSHYGLSDEDVMFFSVHEMADEDHAGIGRDLLSEFATSEEDFQLVLKTVGECLDMMKLMYDSIYDTVKAVH